MVEMVTQLNILWNQLIEMLVFNEFMKELMKLIEW